MGGTSQGARACTASCIASLVANIVAIVCACVAMGAILVWAPPCAGSLELANGNMVPMRCAYTAKVGLLIAIALIVVAGASMVTKKPATVALAVLSIMLMLVTIDTPVSIGVCRSAGMACWDTATWMRLVGAVSLIATLAGAAVPLAGKRIKA